jgi:hypothetical protein
VADLYEVLLVDGDTRWHAGWVVDDDAETDVLLRDHGTVPVFASRAGLEHHAQERGLRLEDDLPDEIDLDLGGWLPRGAPVPPAAEVSELWHLLYDDPVAGRALAGDRLDEAYDDLVEDAPDWFAEHGEVARAALAKAVGRLRSVLRPA